MILGPDGAPIRFEPLSELDQQWEELGRQLEKIDRRIAWEVLRSPPTLFDSKGHVVWSGAENERGSWI